jgi:arylsulfatase A-like enzyme
LYGKGAMRFPYPATDGATRFPELLAAHGVQTASFCGVNFLAGEYGVTRGIAEEHVIATGRRHAFARAVIDPLLQRLERADDGPLFLYAHLMEPHAPYDRGARHGSDRERYLSEIAVVDAQLMRVRGLLLRRFRDRGYLFVTSDHGEAFGEHQTFQHTKTLYEELLRVPLLAWGPGVVPRQIDQHVGLIDLGPTLLDLFGVDTPATFMGQSLVPLLAGRDVPLDRPLLAEGRLRRTLYHQGIKVIDDERRTVVEAFDLARDPQEAADLFDADPARSRAALSALRAFFRVHRASDPSYVPIYKP